MSKQLSSYSSSDSVLIGLLQLEDVEVELESIDESKHFRSKSITLLVNSPRGLEFLYLLVKPSRITLSIS